MKIIEKNEGKKINYNLTGTKLDFADGALTLDLARYQQDDPVTCDIMVDSWIQYDLVFRRNEANTGRDL